MNIIAFRNIYRVSMLVFRVPHIH